MSCSTPSSGPSGVEAPAAAVSRRRLGAALAAALAWDLFGFDALARAAPVASPLLPPRWLARRLPGCTLAGQGWFRWWGFEVYRACLWVGPRGLDPVHLGSLPFALELRYAHGLSGHAIADEAARLMAELELGSARQRGQWLQSMRTSFPDVRAGDRLAGLYRDDPPRTGFWFDGTRVGGIAGRAFAEAFFGIWLSPRTPALALRHALIAGLEPVR